MIEPIGDEVRRELRRFGPAAGLAELVAAWPAAVGDAIAANAWPARIGRDGTVHVATASSAWAFELTQLEETIRARLREELGETTPARVRFAVGPLPEKSAETATERRESAPRARPAAQAAGERIAASIEDPDLRALVARAAAASLARAESGRSV